MELGREWSWILRADPTSPVSPEGLAESWAWSWPLELSFSDTCKILTYLTTTVVSSVTRTNALKWTVVTAQRANLNSQGLNESKLQTRSFLRVYDEIA